MNFQGFSFIVVEFLLIFLGVYSRIIFYINLECLDMRKKNTRAAVVDGNAFLMFIFC